MPSRPPHPEEETLATERRLQVGAALLLALIVLIGIVVRAGVRTVFPVGWWRHW